MFKIYVIYLRNEQSLLFDIFKAFSQIESIHKSDILHPKKTHFLHACATCSELPSSISTMASLKYKCTYKTTIGQFSFVLARMRLIVKELVLLFLTIVQVGILVLLVYIFIKRLFYCNQSSYVQVFFLLSVPKITANLYCICLSIHQICTASA